MTETLARMGREEGIVFAKRAFTPNSHKALLLAVAVRERNAERFEEMNERLFRAYFTEGRNIGDEPVLEAIASDSGIPPETVRIAWADPDCERRLRVQQQKASAVGVTGIPTFVIGDRFVLEGAVPLELLVHAADRSRSGR